MLTVPCSKFQVDNPRWYSWSKERGQIQKSRNYYPAPTDFYRKSKNAGRKPGYSTREKHDNPTAIFNRIEEGKEINPPDSSSISHPTDSSSISQVEDKPTRQ